VTWLPDKADPYTLMLTIVQSRSDTKINLYGLFNTEAAMAETTLASIGLVCSKVGDCSGSKEELTLCTVCVCRDA